MTISFSIIFIVSSNCSTLCYVHRALFYSTLSPHHSAMSLRITAIVAMQLKAVHTIQAKKLTHTTSKKCKKVPMFNVMQTAMSFGHVWWQQCQLRMHKFLKALLESKQGTQIVSHIVMYSRHWTSLLLMRDMTSCRSAFVQH